MGAKVQILLILFIFDICHISEIVIELDMKKVELKI